MDKYCRECFDSCVQFHKEQYGEESFPFNWNENWLDVPCEHHRRTNMERKIERKAVVIINEQHSLFPEQEEILNKGFDSWEFIKVPAEGWTLDEMRREVWVWFNKGSYNVVFASPIPFLIKKITAMAYEYPDTGFCGVAVFHNDHREKKELPGGKIIQVVSPTGWQLV